MKNIGLLEKLSFITPCLFLVLGLLIAIAGHRFHYYPYGMITLGFAVVFSGQIVQSKIKAHMIHLKSQAEAVKEPVVEAVKQPVIESIKEPVVESIKQPSRLLDANLVAFDNGKFSIEIETENSIPFKARWIVATRKNKVVSGMMLSEQELYPNESCKKWQYDIIIHQDEIVNDYLELRLDFISINAAELNYPSDLKGKIIKKYKLVNGKPEPQS